MEANSRRIRGTYWCHACSEFTIPADTEEENLVCRRCEGGFVEDLELLLEMDPRLLLLAEEGDQLFDLLPLPPSDLFRQSPFVDLFRQSPFVDLALASPEGHSPASKKAVDAMEDLRLREEHLPSECSVCKEEFTAGCTAKRMPCGHIYHKECILLWLKSQNTCPLCRFRLPSVMDELLAQRRRNRFSLRKLFPLGSLVQFFRRRSRRSSSS